MKYVAGVLCALLAIATVIAVSIILNRIDSNRARTTELKTEIAGLRAKLSEPAKPPPALELIESQLHVCKMRTEWIRIVLETFVPLGDRVRLPDPPPGWDRWPTPNPEE